MPYQDPLQDLLGKLTLEEKVRLLTGATGFTLHGSPEIGLEPLSVSDGPTGVRGIEVVGLNTAALLPSATLLAATWNEDVLRLAGEILADEAERQQIHVVLGPTINLHRSPLGGRLFEAYAEDPLLTGRLASSYVQGLQGRGIGACLKHLVANEAETERQTVDNHVDEATLREVYLLPFEIAVEESHPWSVMAAYNKVNGSPATEQGHVQQEVLKGEWAYDGLVMSDWGATHSAASAANSGLDLVMPGPRGPWGDALVAAVRAGDVDESTIDDHVLRLLRLADRTQGLEGGRTWRRDMPDPGSAERTEQLTRMAAQGMTVLANDGVLPLARDQKVAVVGRHAVDTVVMGGGSAEVRPVHRVSIADGVAAAFDDVSVQDGVEVRVRPRLARSGALLDPQTGEPGIRVRVLGADGGLLCDEHVSSSTTAFGVDADLPEDAVLGVIEADVTDRGAVEVGLLGVGDWTFLVGDEQPHSLSLDIGNGDPADKVLRPPGWTIVTEVGSSLRLRAEVVLHDRYVGRVGLAARPAPATTEDAVAAAVEAVRAADVAVVVVGLTEEDETEGHDKVTLALPGDQDVLVAAVATAARRTVVVVNAASPVLLPWLDEVDAVLVAGFPGQEAGHAVAAALLGDVEPAGRLVTCFPSADGAHPSWNVVPTDGVLTYEEGVFPGYRGYAAGRAPAPTYWFGHGLGYGAWEYAAPSLTASDPVPVLDVPITNNGEHASREVVQVYLEPADEDQPVRLVGWGSAVVPPGGTATVTVTCEARLWRRWDIAADRWASLARGGRLLVARGLGDVRATLDLPGRLGHGVR